VRRFQAGHLRAWSSFHIFAGSVGPTLVLAHSAFEFNGLAGISTVLTFVVVGSGFIGRYLYTSTPRTRAGAEMSLTQITVQMTNLQNEIDQLLTERRALPQARAINALHYEDEIHSAPGGTTLQASHKLRCSAQPRSRRQAAKNRRSTTTAAIVWPVPKS
jgi:hypothetical protein